MRGVSCYLSKGDIKSAFRILCILRDHWRYLIMKARNPIDHKWYYFVDKCLPFGAAISCAHFQRFSNALAHLIQWKTHVGYQLSKPLMNYLDDFLFIALLKYVCTGQLKVFVQLCEQLNIPLAVEKMVEPTTLIVFLGLLIDTVHQMVLLPKEKVEAGQQLLSALLDRTSRKVTVHELQKLTGFFNFLGRAVVPGRAFTRRMYAYTKKEMKPHHHVRLNSELRLDMEMWQCFLHHPSVFARPFLDFKTSIDAQTIDMYSDSAGKAELGYGATCLQSWMYGQWDPRFIKQQKPSIEYLELWALVAGVLNWIHRFRNQRVILFCDNMSVVSMVNNTTSSCPNCMVLIRIFVLKTLTENVRVFARYVQSRQNYFSDALSRIDLPRFWRLSKQKGKTFETEPTPPPQQIWPLSKIWVAQVNKRK